MHLSDFSVKVELIKSFLHYLSNTVKILSILRGLGKWTSPLNIFPISFAAEHELGRLRSLGQISRGGARKTIDEVLCKESDACFNSQEWMELMQGVGKGLGLRIKKRWVGR